MMKKCLLLLCAVGALALGACSRCVANDQCNEEGRRRVLEINVSTIPSATLRYSACQNYHYRELTYGSGCVISWQ